MGSQPPPEKIVRWAVRTPAGGFHFGPPWWARRRPLHMPHTSSATLTNYMGHYNIPPCTNLRAEMPLIHILNHPNGHIFERHPKNSMVWLLRPSDLAEVWIGTMLWAGWTPRGILLDAQTLKSSRVPAAVISTTLGAWGSPRGWPNGPTDNVTDDRQKCKKTFERIALRTLRQSYRCG